MPLEAFAEAVFDDDIRSGGFARRLLPEGGDVYPALSMIEAITSGDDPMGSAESVVEAALAKAAVSPTVRE
jgi:hypothetical protein